MTNQKLTSAMYHLNVAHADLAKPRIHLMQAESILPKRYNALITAIVDVRKLLDRYDDAISNAITAAQIELDNPAPDVPPEHGKKSK